MVFKKVKANLFSLNADVIVCAMNTKGVAGCGTALGFKLKFPETHKVYQQLCKDKQLQLGVPVSVPNYDGYGMDKPSQIMLFPTKVAPSRTEKTKLSTLSNGLQHIKNTIKLTSVYPDDFEIALPKLGAGAGGLSDQVVIDLIEKELGGPEIKQTILLCI